MVKNLPLLHCYYIFLELGVYTLPKITIRIIHQRWYQTPKFGSWLKVYMLLTEITSYDQSS